MYQLHNRFIIWIIAAVLLVGVGCTTTPPPTFYQLDEPANTMLSGLMRGVAIGVGPINMAAYLDRPQIVTRATDHKLNLSEFNRWAEPLKESVTQNALLTKVSIIREPSGGEGYDKLIAAQNRALQTLSREIADAVKSNQ
ncbi:MAG: membrane integrity-associated transporter subunit PqiC [Deltaproteobacteria bacterium]|nr:membrane integrity-associated transporter subunit PqiC [Deltaproteobacteria bacterium]